MIGLEGCKRCPDCKSELPAFSIVKKLFGKGEEAQLQCEKHGHMALGDTAEQVVTHWNIYVDFVEKSRKGK